MPMQAWHLIVLLMAHPHMPYYYATASAQSEAMSLISLSPPTSIAETTTAAAAATTTAAANRASASQGTTTISYPSGAPTVNYEDTVLVSYDTPWNSPKLTVYCEEGSGFSSYDANNVPSSGTYNLSPIERGFHISKYPSLCHIALSDSADSGNSVNGGDFTLVSTSGAVKTYAVSTTITAATGFIASTTSSKSATTSHSTSSTSSPATSSTSVSSNSTGADSAASSSTITPASPSSSSHNSLSGGAKAGIAIAVILIIVALILAAFFYRRQRQKHARELQSVQSELATERAQRASEKAYLDSILKAAGKPDTEHGGKIHVAEDVRQSSDWRRFFSSKAASAAGSMAGAAAAVGAAIANSRPGSRRASMARSRLGTSEGKEKDLPAVPAIPNGIFAVPPSPTATDSVTGRGSPSEMGETRSTTGLIRPGKK